MCIRDRICARSVLPVVADIHFSADLAIEAARRGAAKLRINPGNIGGLEEMCIRDRAATSIDQLLAIDAETRVYAREQVPLLGGC